MVVRLVCYTLLQLFALDICFQVLDCRYKAGIDEIRERSQQDEPLVFDNPDCGPFALNFFVRILACAV